MHKLRKFQLLEKSLIVEYLPIEQFHGNPITGAQIESFQQLKITFIGELFLCPEEFFRYSIFEHKMETLQLLENSRNGLYIC